MSDATPNFHFHNGHRWAATSAEGRLQYLTGVIDGIQYASVKLRATMEVDLMLGVGVPVGVDGARFVEWAQKFKDGIGLEGYFRDISIGELADALTHIYTDTSNREILIVSALYAAASIARGQPDDEVAEQLERVRRKEN